MRDLPYTIDDKRRVLQAVENNNGNITRASKVANVPVGVIRDWIADPTEIWFNENMTEITNRAIDLAEALVMKISKRDFKAATFLLTHHPEGRRRGWGNKLEIQGQLKSWKEEA
jgi:hypothetical protein